MGMMECIAHREKLKKEARSKESNKQESTESNPNN